MILKTDSDNFIKLIGLVHADDKTDQTGIDRENQELLEFVHSLETRLQVAKDSYKELDKEGKDKTYFKASCTQCDWWGSSRLLTGGGQIADTGDYGDSCCPVCDSVEIEG